MWIRCCIILHNLILRIEAGNINTEWREELYNAWDAREGDAHCHREEANIGSDGNENETELQCARHRVMTDGQKFRHRVMKRLFDSPTSGAVHRI